MDALWTLSELVGEVAQRMAALPAPTNGQVRAVPDERTIRYYAALGLLDRPAEMRGRTALYTARHAAQIVAIKRMQLTGKSLAEIQALWPSMADATLAQMSGIALSHKKAPARAEFWKAPPAPSSPRVAPPAAVEVRIEVAPNISIVLSVPEGIAMSPADVRAIRAAAAPLVAELASRRLGTHPEGDL